MEILVGNIVYILTDDNQYLRLDKIDDVHIAGNRIKCFSGGAFIDITHEMQEPALSQKLTQIRNAQEKYAPIVQLCTRYSYLSGKMNYKGTHNTINPMTSDPNWAIFKYSYTGNDLVLEQGPIVGSWDDRASLAWS